MTARLSCSLTIEQVRDRSKTVTRRRVDTWKKLAAGDRLVLIERGMGLAKGEKQVVLAEVDVVSVRVEPLYDITEEECAAEGFPEMEPGEFCGFWCDSHHMNPRSQSEAMAIMVRRIEWRYIGAEASRRRAADALSPRVAAS